MPNPTPKSKEEICAALLAAYERKIPAKDRYCHEHLEKEWASTQPFEGKRVLFNCHITLSTLMTHRLLLIGGAEVEITASQKPGEELHVQESALEKAIEAGLTYHRDGVIPAEKCNGYYDVVIDCGAGMLGTVTPKEGGGAVELTHTDPRLYNGITYPVINVDGSHTKKIETGIGTGDSLVRLLTQHAQGTIWIALSANNSFRLEHHLSPTVFEQNVVDHLATTNVHTFFTEQTFMIFGGGKVGRGIRNALISTGVPKDRMFLIDTDPDVVLEMKTAGYKNAYVLNETNLPVIKAKCMDESSRPNYVITATGKLGAISEQFDPKCFGRATLINMGTPDEFGGKFPADRLLNARKGPANFFLEFPTIVMYLDPIFALLAQSAMYITQTAHLAPGLHDTPVTIDGPMLTCWQEQHGDDIWAHTACAKELIRKIQLVKREPARWASLEPPISDQQHPLLACCSPSPSTAAFFQHGAAAAVASAAPHAEKKARCALDSDELPKDRSGSDPDAPDGSQHGSPGNSPPVSPSASQRELLAAVAPQVNELERSLVKLAEERAPSAPAGLPGMAPGQ